MRYTKKYAKEILDLWKDKTGYFDKSMTAEQFRWAWLRSEFIEPRFLRSEPVHNIYYDALSSVVEAHEKEVYKQND